MLPIPPGCPIDTERAIAGDGDPADGTNPKDGWALFAGTSAAAPQVAGAAGCCAGSKGRHASAGHRRAHRDGVDVLNGFCHPRFNNPATAGRDRATGFGLVNVVRGRGGDLNSGMAAGG
jgi:subtilisin family serine protease